MSLAKKLRAYHFEMFRKLIKYEISKEETLRLEGKDHWIIEKWVDPADVVCNRRLFHLYFSWGKIYKGLIDPWWYVLCLCSMLFDFESGNHQIDRLVSWRCLRFFLCISELLIHEDSWFFELFEDEFSCWQLYLELLGCFG